MSNTIRTLALAALGIISIASVYAEDQNNSDSSCRAAKSQSVRTVWPPAIPYVFTGNASGQAVDPREWAKIWMEDEAETAAIQSKQYLDSLNQSNLSAATSTELEMWNLSYPSIDQTQSFAAK